MGQPRRQTLLLVLGFCLAIAATFFFGYRAGRTARRIRRDSDSRYNDSRQNEPIKAWMSVPFIAHTHHVSEELLFQAIRIPPSPRDHRPIRDIARSGRVPVAELIRDLQAAIGTGAGSETAPQSGKAP